ncbi:MAG: 50S ribosomal protein L3 N(5)-glutamine methyltransferase [Gammaproteobacteria bacterium]|nr:50S ribosomal protein L3 N(5)-glutamine methyltransferase [Gammaproteobacteria bacterium]MBU1646825.1 50S ribosomal protein L3 N(5)-glutamine methyltransferase [Gammaproteobacteria bacterium]MBU1971660.1 50S ribosomal protein L3 N(5)-glutamine methyltransferase [Gammaproteobacteria bacterium]
MQAQTADLLTMRDWLRWAVSRFNEAGLFFGHGTDNAFDEAAWLIMHALRLPHDQLDVFLDARLTPDERLAVLNILQLRIARRLPAAYLTQEAWLGDFRFYVDERVIVPRSYFAELLREGFAPWIADPDEVADTLDLCTGSGCLAILMAHAFPNASVDAVDISADALAVAQRNVTDYGLDDQVRLVRSDVFSKLGKRRYDLIISNPPYVTAAAMAALPEEYRREPALALAAGDDGLDIVRTILANALRHLKPDGLLAIEVGHNREIVEAAFPELPLTWIDTPTAEGKVFLVNARDLKAHT